MRRRGMIGAVAGAAASALVATVAFAAAGPNGIERVSVASGGGQSEGGHANTAHISADGRHVAFVSTASDLVEGDTNDRSDVFVHDRQTGATERVSVASDGTQADDTSLWPSISADGRYVAFTSLAGNLGGPPGINVYVRDRQAGTTERVSVEDLSQPLSSGQKPSLSADGRVVALDAHTPQIEGRIVIRDRATGATEVVSLGPPEGSPEGTRDSSSLSEGMISGNGQVLVFHGIRRSPFGTQKVQVFAYDRATGGIELVTATPSGADANGGSVRASVSHDGRYVAFESGATDLVAGDDNNQVDVFVHDRQTGATQLASIRPDGRQFTRSSVGGIGPSGRTIVFRSDGSVWLRDLDAGTTELVDEPLPGRPLPGGAFANSGVALLAPQSISADDRLVAFESTKDNLVEDDTNVSSDIFVRDRGGPPPEFSIDDVSMPEGNSGATEARFTVSLAEPAADDLMVEYATADGTATAGSDYEGGSDTVTIPAGATSATIAVPVIGDGEVEPDETFTVTISSPANPAAVLTDATGTATIENDDVQRQCTAVENLINVIRGLFGQPPIDCRAA